MIHCNSEFRAYVSTKLRVAVNHVCFHLVTQFYIYIYKLSVKFDTRKIVLNTYE